MGNFTAWLPCSLYAADTMGVLQVGTADTSKEPVPADGLAKERDSAVLESLQIFDRVAAYKSDINNTEISDEKWIDCSFNQNLTCYAPQRLAVLQFTSSLNPTPLPSLLSTFHPTVSSPTRPHTP